MATKTTDVIEAIRKDIGHTAELPHAVLANRRGILAGFATVGLLVPASRAQSVHSQDAPDLEAQQKDYRETEHILRYYELARR